VTETVSKKHKVVIVFSGVVAVGPPLESGTPDSPFVQKGPLFGVMPPPRRRLIKYRDTQDKEVAEYSRVHFPVIFTNFESGGRKPDDVYKEFGIWYPIRERLQIHLDGDATPGVLRYVHDSDYGKPGKLGDPQGKVPADNPIEDFAAVPDMQVVSPPRSTLRAGTLDARAAEVAAQVFVPEGTLRAGAEDKRKYGLRVTYHPPVKGGGPHVVVAVPQARITVEVDDRLDIQSWSLDTGEELDALSFTIDRDGEVWIGNLDAADIRVIINRLADPFKGYEGAKPLSCDVDFARVYELTEGAGDVVLPCDDPPEAGDRKCYIVMVKPPTPTKEV
jgi:hypothetical protein